MALRYILEPVAQATQYHGTSPCWWAYDMLSLLSFHNHETTDCTEIILTAGLADSTARGNLFLRKNSVTDLLGRQAWDL
jgi:hypothetical protein